MAVGRWSFWLLQLDYKNVSNHRSHPFPLDYSWRSSVDGFQKHNRVCVGSVANHAIPPSCSLNPFTATSARLNSRWLLLGHFLAPGLGRALMSLMICSVSDNFDSVVTLTTSLSVGRRITVVFTQDFPHYFK